MAEVEEDSSGSGECPLDAEVHSAVGRITSQPPLSKSERLSGFLRYIVDETLAGRADKIIGYTIGVDVFGKPESFDPSVDTIVRVEAGRLRRSLDQYYREAGAEDPVEIIVPKGAYVPEFRYRTGKRVITAQVTSPTDQYISIQSDRGPSIVVLPFANYGVDEKDQFFADGLTEETIANLARFKDLFVFSRSTTSALAQEGMKIRQLREELGVDFVVEGSVRKTPQMVRATIQLIDAETDGHILAENFDRACTPEGVFEIQDEIARLVAARVADRHGPIGRYVQRARRSGGSKTWETYNWITRFYDYYATHDPQRHAEVRDGLDKALEHDEDSSDGWAALSIVLLDEFRIHMNERHNFPALEKSLENAQRAVFSDPENAFAYQALAIAHFHSRNEADFHVAAERSLNLNPGHADVLADIGHCYCMKGDWDRGLPLMKRAIELSPVHPGWYHHGIAWHHQMSGNACAAIEEIAQAPMPGFYWHHAFLAAFHAGNGDHDLASDQVRELLSIYPDFCERVKDEFAIWCVNDDLTEIMLNGWRKAGLEIV